jgi:hypothetical protein
MKKGLLLLIATALLSLSTAREAHAWGGFHRGFTSFSPGGGFSHSGETARYGPYGEHTSSHSFGYNPSSGFYHSGYGQSSGYGGSSYHSSYGSDGYGGFHGGFQGAYGEYGAYGGAYRRW